jgi:hypothetical protein
VASSPEAHLPSSAPSSRRCGLTALAAIPGLGLSHLRRTTRGIDSGTPSVASPASTPGVDALEIEIAAINGLRFSPAAVTIPARVPVRTVYTNQTAVYYDLVIPELARRTPRRNRMTTRACASSTRLSAPGRCRDFCRVEGACQRALLPGS